MAEISRLPAVNAVRAWLPQEMPPARIRAAVALLFVGDALFILAALRADRWLGLDLLPEGWDVHLLEQDDSVVEAFGASQAAAAGLLLVATRLRRGGGVHLGWGLVFLFVAADDWFKIHENVGGILAMSSHLPDPVILRKQDIGELAVWAAAGVFLFGLLALALRRASGPTLGFGLVMFAPFAALVGAGAVLDMTHQIVGANGGRLEMALVVAEDGGEMFAITAALAVVLLERWRLGEEGARLLPGITAAGGGASRGRSPRGAS